MMRFSLVALLVAVYIYQAELFRLTRVFDNIEKELGPKQGKDGKPVVFSWYGKGPNNMKSYHKIWFESGDKAKNVKLDDVKIDVPPDVAEEDKEFLKDETTVRRPSAPRKKVYCFVSPDAPNRSEAFENVRYVPAIYPKSTQRQEFNFAATFDPSVNASKVREEIQATTEALDELGSQPPLDQLQIPLPVSANNHLFPNAKWREPLFEWFPEMRTLNVTGLVDELNASGQQSFSQPNTSTPFESTADNWLASGKAQMMAPIHEQSENMIWERAVPNATALEQHSPQELDTVIQQQVVPSKDPKPLSKNAEPSSPSETVESREKATRPHMFTWAIPNYTVAAEPTKKVQDGKKKEAAGLLLSTEVDSPPNKSGGG
ncbi:hypothetical protein M514_15236 [Trichuris suis]|uniref:Uncharacterized protein n=1 Tax=Trichuris suis TaxID=68888 RepID=A0A085NSF4_9BILA|nr:hypothetical protein M514_15236 [Trichuris suis]